MSLEGLLARHGVAAHSVVGRGADAPTAAKQLRRRAEPGACVLLAARPKLSAWSRLAALWGQSRPEQSACEELARALLCAGFETPCVLADSGELVAVTAGSPLRRDPLDEIFDSFRNP